jgi:hypothetical protein
MEDGDPKIRVMKGGRTGLLILSTYLYLSAHYGAVSTSVTCYPGLPLCDTLGGLVD